MRTTKPDPANGLGALASVIMRGRDTSFFKPDPVPEDLLQELLDLSTYAPSGYNLQPWRFIVVRDPKGRRRLRKAAMDQAKVEQAPVVIIACGDMAAWRDGDLDRTIEDGRTAGTIPDESMAQAVRRNAAAFLESTDLSVWVTRQTMIAVSFLMLAAEASGLDTALMEGFWEDKVRESFGIPETVRVVALLALGYGQKPDKPFGGRFDLDRVVFEERHGRPWPARVTAGRA